VVRVLAETLSASIMGVEGLPVRVEVDVAFGLPALTIVGLAGSQVQEARERVRSALRNSGFEVPARRITINLSPADLPKDGTGYDLPIAVGILAASGQLREVDRLRDTALVGELGLDGGVRPVPGTMALAAASFGAGVPSLIVAAGATGEAAAVTGLRVHGAASLGEAVAHLAGVRDLPMAEPPLLPARVPTRRGPDLVEVAGQALARRGLEIALAGHHNLALCGPPGIGKTLLLRCAADLVPPLEDDEAIEVSRIYSVAGLLDRRAPVLRERPFRAPHHTISTQALVGGGPRVRPGEASLAHRGILLLDETLQFRSDALDALREPLEGGSVTIARVDGVLTMPARFTLLAAFNPCPCGWRGSRQRECTCEDATARRYLARLSGPLRDRIDLWVTMLQPDPGTAASTDGIEPSQAVAARIGKAWRHQLQRQGCVNGDLPVGALNPEQGFGPVADGILAQRARRFRMSPRRIHRAARVARTIADLACSIEVAREHIDEALTYRGAVNS
jgi:magnesium chelatase family protein